jgi:dipeptidyl aminopeptidase/acylaminoacyl peptidase
MKRVLSAVLLFACATWVASAAPARRSARHDNAAPAHGAAARHAAAHQQSSGTFTIEQVMSAPFPVDLTPAPAKGMFAWVFNAEGKRNVWVAEPSNGGAYSVRQVTNYTEDDGQDVGEISWTPDASAIVYTHGGDFEFPKRTYPNPARLAAGVEQDVMVVPVSGGEPRKIGEGHSPAVSPDGQSVAYVLHGEIWLAKLDGSDKPQQLIHELGENSGLRWSPDGKSIAFVSARGDHSFIGVYTLGSKVVNYLDPSTDHDGEPAWSPDGKQIAFIRVPSSTEHIFEPHRTGPPWSIRIADVATGKGHEIWRADDGPGSVFHAVEADNELLWGAGDRLVFPWEKTGWVHLYSIPASGAENTRDVPTLMTPGDFELEHVSISPDRKMIVYTSNQNDIDRRHIWKVAVDSTQPEQLTSGTGLEVYPVFASDNRTVAILRAGAQMPLRPAVIERGGHMRDLADNQIPAEFPAHDLVTPQQVIFSSADGMYIHGQLFLGANANDGQRHPAIVFFHGGSRRQMLLGWHYMDYYSGSYALNQYLANHGFVVLSVNYRSGIGYGLNFREALDYGADGASEFNDVEGAALYLRSRADVDAKRIGLWGGSYGGYLTAMGLARSSDLYAAGVDMHGVHDWNVEIGNWMAYDPAAHAEAARRALESSPIASVDTWRAPVLLIQGDDDRNVQFTQMGEMADALRKHGVPYQELVFPDEIHGFLRHITWVRAYTASAQFFQQQLKP